MFVTKSDFSSGCDIGCDVLTNWYSIS